MQTQIQLNFFFFVLYFLGVKSGDNALKFKGTVTVVWTTLLLKEYTCTMYCVDLWLLTWLCDCINNNNSSPVYNSWALAVAFVVYLQVYQVVVQVWCNHTK